MGYAVYEDRWASAYGVKRWAGYGVPAVCDTPACTTEIDRGMGYRCERIWTYDDEKEDLDPSYEGDESEGCMLHFCFDHLEHSIHGDDATPKPDTAEWIHHMETDDSWAKWREEQKPATIENATVEV